MVRRACLKSGENLYLRHAQSIMIPLAGPASARTLSRRKVTCNSSRAAVSMTTGARWRRLCTETVVGDFTSNCQRPLGGGTPRRCSPLVRPPGPLRLPAHMGHTHIHCTHTMERVLRPGKRNSGVQRGTTRRAPFRRSKRQQGANRWLSAFLLGVCGAGSARAPQLCYAS